MTHSGNSPPEEILKRDPALQMPDPIDTKEQVEKGEKEALKELVKRTEVNKERLHELAEQSKKLLFRCKSIFPFDLFPDEITIDIHAVNVYKRTFFRSGAVHSIYIPNIAEIYVERSLLFAKVKIIDKNFTDNVLNISYLLREDAARIRRIVHGLIQANSNKIDLTNIPAREIVKDIYDIGEMTAMHGSPK